MGPSGVAAQMSRRGCCLNLADASCEKWARRRPWEGILYIFMKKFFYTFSNVCDSCKCFPLLDLNPHSACKCFPLLDVNPHSACAVEGTTGSREITWLRYLDTCEALVSVGGFWVSNLKYVFSQTVTLFFDPFKPLCS